MRTAQTLEADIAAYDRTVEEVAPRGGMSQLLQVFGFMGFVCTLVLGFLLLTDVDQARVVVWPLIGGSVLGQVLGGYGRWLYRTTVAPVDLRNWARYTEGRQRLSDHLGSEFGIITPPSFTVVPFAPLADPFHEARRFKAAFNDRGRDVVVTTRIRGDRVFYVVEITA